VYPPHEGVRQTPQRAKTPQKNEIRRQKKEKPQLLRTGAINLPIFFRVEETIVKSAA
jgi:hypothetical protein